MAAEKSWPDFSAASDIILGYAFIAIILSISFEKITSLAYICTFFAFQAYAADCKTLFCDEIIG
jgi:hypothetical protein